MSAALAVIHFLSESFLGGPACWLVCHMVSISHGGGFHSTLGFFSNSLPYCKLASQTKRLHLRVAGGDGGCGKLKTYIGTQDPEALKPSSGPQNLVPGFHLLRALGRRNNPAVFSGWRIGFIALAHVREVWASPRRTRGPCLGEGRSLEHVLRSIQFFDPKF